MARPKEFDPDDVLARVMDQFWVHGYDATSMDDLVRAAGIGRQSLYDTFGGKRQLYLAALDRFASQDGAALLEILARSAPIRDVLRAMFDTLVDISVKDRLGKGCMLTNAATTLAPSDPEVRKRVCAATESLERALAQRLAAAQRAGEIPKRHDATALARYFASIVGAIRTTAKTVRDREHLGAIVDVALSVLDR